MVRPRQLAGPDQKTTWFQCDAARHPAAKGCSGVCSRAVRPTSERKDLVAIGFALGLVAWYAGGWTALDRMLDTGPIVRVTLLLVAAAFVVGGAYELIRRRALKTALTNAVLLAIVCALLGSTLGALVNRYADGTQVRVEEAVLTGFKNPNKGPRRAAFEFITRETPKSFSLTASSAEGCVEGSRAQLEVRQGFFGIPWVARVSCPAPTLGACTPAQSNLASGTSSLTLRLAGWPT